MLISWTFKSFDTRQFKKGKNTKNAKNTRKNAAKKLSICPLMK